MYLYERMLLANRVILVILNHAALILSFLPTSPSPNPNDKLQVRLSWNVSPSCNLLPMFLSNSANVPCDLNKENPDLKLEYKFLEGVNTLPYEELDFASGLLDVLGMIQNQSEIRLFELQPSRSSIKFIGSNCSEIGTNELGCFSELDMNVIFLIRMVEKNMINIYLRNDPFDYEIENKDQVVFTRYGSSDPFDGWYYDQYVDINFQNGTNFKLNFINYTANFWYPDMAGQTIEVHFVAEFSGDFNILGSLTNENFGLEINQTIFELVDIDKKGFAEYQTDMSPSSIRILSQPIMIEIPFKNKILNVTKLNATTLKIEWTKPMGKYDAIKLVCEAEDFVDSNTYSEDSTSGNCVHPLAFSGQLTKIATFVKKSDEFYKTDKKVLIIDPEAVSSIQIKEYSTNYVKFSWNFPMGSISYFNVSCIDTQTNTIVDQGSFLNTNKTECQNLQPNKKYNIEIITVVEKFNSTATNRAVNEYSTILFSTTTATSPTTNVDLSLLSLEELTKINFTGYQSDNVEQLIKTLQNNLTIIKDQNEDILEFYINNCSLIIANIAERQTEKEKIDLLEPFWNLIDNFMDNSNQIFKNTMLTSNRLSKSLEVISNKIDLDNKTENSYLNTNFNNFFIKSSIIKNGTVDFSDIGFVSKYVNQEIIESINSDSTDTFLSIDNLRYAAYFNRDAIQELVSENKTPRITYVGFSASKLFNGRAKNLENFEVDCNSSLQIGPFVVSASKIPQIESRENLLNLIYEQQQNEKFCDKRKVNSTFQCVFWDYDINDWNSSGCNYIKIEKDGKILHKCSCNHTTNFALLMVVDSISFCDWCELVLFYVSIIGICTSIIGLLVTIIYDIAISILPAKKAPKQTGMMERYSKMSKEYLKVITAWCSSLLVMNCVYIAFSFFKYDETDISGSQRASCIAIGVLLHYFLLSSFCFSTCITLIQLIIVYKSFKVFRFILLKSLAFSLGVPIIPVAIVIGISRDAYINPNKYCWLHSLFAIFGALVPIAIILLINLVLFVMIGLSHSNVIKKRNKYLHKKENLDEKGVKQEVILILTCFVNTGLTWLFGFLVTIPADGDWIYARFVYGLIFCLLNATQGFQIFFTYFIISKRRRKILEEKLKFQIELIKKRLKKPKNKISCT